MKLRLVITAILSMGIMEAVAVDASNRYRSSRNPERKVRESTELIVLHTTEAPARSSLNKLSDRGEAHFCVTEEGEIYRIVDRDKEAFHAGRSMWRGKEDVDKFSIGIECVGYHDKPMGMVQLKAIAELVRELKSMYRLSDDRVVCHGHIAYGAPNKWQRYKHRGRKRCGMLFATPTVRKILGLRSRPAYDPDVRAKRLIIADDYLNRVLYGSLDIMSKHYKVKVNTPSVLSKKSTINRPPASIEELKRRGYIRKGMVTKEMTALKLVGERWNDANTYYTIRDKVIPGNILNPAKIEKGMGVWIKP